VVNLLIELSSLRRKVGYAGNSQSTQTCSERRLNSTQPVLNKLAKNWAIFSFFFTWVELSRALWVGLGQHHPL